MTSAKAAAFDKILCEVIDGAARLTLNRPERTNALDQEMLDEINTAVAMAEADDAVRAVIVRGAGASFSSVKAQMEAKPTGVTEWRPLLRKDFHTVMRSCRCTSSSSSASG